MDVSATVNGDIAMDVSPNVKWWHCDGRIAECKMAELHPTATILPSSIFP
jgi:hypothetical protein